MSPHTESATLLFFASTHSYLSPRSHRRLRNLNMADALFIRLGHSLASISLSHW